uniref:Uncharacterized protein n=1 Tax=Opuntia streptacantha TaxID=393608 RepID=A0A7C8YQZ4_OPUST
MRKIATMNPRRLFPMIHGFTIKLHDQQKTKRGRCGSPDQQAVNIQDSTITFRLHKGGVKNRCKSNLLQTSALTMKNLRLFELSEKKPQTYLSFEPGNLFKQSLPILLLHN